MVNRLISTALGVIGGIAGGISGFVLFGWLLDQNLRAWVLPGAAIGLGCGLLSRHASVPRGVVCGVAAIILGLYTEWHFSLQAEASFVQFALHSYRLPKIMLVLIAIGAALSYYLGKEAGFLAPRNDKVPSATGGARE
jgi:hypothetical protein